MRASAPSLLPILRSDAQARLLTVLFLDPAVEHSVADLQKRTDGATATVHREVERLERAGLVRSRRVGRSRLVRTDDRSPYHAELRSLIVKAFGPAHVLRGELAGIDGVVEAHIFGSWAERSLGREGTPPADVDVVVIGEPEPDDVYAACHRAEEALARPVNAAILSEEEWHAPRTGFVRAVREGSLVQVL